MILTGGATHFRSLNQVEFFARRLTHRLIGIPQNVESLAANIRDRRIDLKHLSASERDALLALYGNVTGSRCESLREVDEATSRSEEHTSELQSLMRISYAVLCLKKKQVNRMTDST